MTVSYWQDASGDRTIECDVCVVGAGVVGLYLARLIAGQGRSVVVLEARHVAAGATGRNAGMVLTGSAYYYHQAVATYGRELAHQLWRLSLHNRDIVKGLSQEFGTLWIENGSLLLALDDTEAEDLTRAYDAMCDDDIQCKITYKDPLKRGFTAVVEQPGDAGIHPVKFCEAMSRSMGAQLFEQSEVHAIEPLPGGGVELRSRRLTVRCGMAALCTNAYAPLLHPYFESKVVPTRGQVLRTEPLGTMLFGQMCYCDYGYEYFRQLPDTSILLGGWRHHFREAEVGYEDRVTRDIQGGLEGFLLKYFPEAANLRVTHRWSGTMGFSMDGIPLVGALPDMPNVYFAVGFTGHGLGFGLATAERLAAHMLFGRDLEWLDASRLDKKDQAVASEH
ncbi:MAG TPA: FAD-dependent oxidoreductase [Chloroflexia bacterium]|jgi:glycine/D-amino acid oxidase-like deaminating enzyme